MAGEIYPKGIGPVIIGTGRQQKHITLAEMYEFFTTHPKEQARFNKCMNCRKKGFCHLKVGESEDENGMCTESETEAELLSKILLEFSEPRKDMEIYIPERKGYQNGYNRAARRGKKSPRKRRNK